MSKAGWWGRGVRQLLADLGNRRVCRQVGVVVQDMAG